MPISGERVLSLPSSILLFPLSSMQQFSFLQLVVAATTVMAQQPGEDGRYTISAPGIKAQVSLHLCCGYVTD